MENQTYLSEQRTGYAVNATFARVMRNVYAWMTAGLVMTALTALLVATTPQLMATIFSSKIAFFGIIIAELALVWYLSAHVTEMSLVKAGTLFALYAVINGLTLSVIFLAYDVNAIVQAFAVTAGVFGAMTLVGLFIKKDLSSLGRVLIMALIGLLIATLVNIFMHNSTLNIILNYAGVLIFTGLTAYDTQKIKQMVTAYADDETTANKLAVWGSLTLYLDFINLFLYILRFIGRK